MTPQARTILSREELARLREKELLRRQRISEGHRKYWDAVHQAMEPDNDATSDDTK